MADEDNLSAAQIAGWLTATETMVVALASKGQFAGQVLNERLKGGLLVAVAAKTSRAIGTGPVTVLDRPQKIPTTLWQHRADDSFWSSGDAHFKVRDTRHVAPPTNVW